MNSDHEASEDAGACPPWAEWLEADGLGGFASGTVCGIRTRRYHGLLDVAAAPPCGRVMLVNGLDVFVDVDGRREALSAQLYAPDVTHPDGHTRMERFEAEPWPRWTYRLLDGTRIEQEIVVRHGSPLVAITWKLTGAREGVRLSVRPLISGRDAHALHVENPHLRFDVEDLGQPDGIALRWKPYDSLPGIVCSANAEYEHGPEWYRSFLYSEERERGYDYTEDLASPGELRFDLSRGEAVLILAADSPALLALLRERPAQALITDVRSQEKQRRARFSSRLARAADAYVVQRGIGKTILAGYPWFADWGRDTFIALRGICIAGERLEDARSILLEWAGAISEGMLPNRFTEQGNVPEYNAVDAPLWFIVAVHELFEAAAAGGIELPEIDRARLSEAVNAILDGCCKGTRYGIRMDEDGLLRAGEPGVQLTWMDAKLGDQVITPRIGKPVEIQALWLNALRIGSSFSPRWRELGLRGKKSFAARFWNEKDGCLFDVVDEDHARGRLDASFRPNQILAVGGLPFALVEGRRARRIVDAVEERLLTPLGLRTLAPEDVRFARRYEGGPGSRDGAYHQGTAWPWLIGPFVEAWVRVRGNTQRAKREARGRFLAPLIAHLDEGGLGHISEIADAVAPHTPRGCPFQAWSVGEALRLDLVVLADRRASPTIRAETFPHKVAQ